MGKVWSYVIISLGLLLMLQFAGLPVGATKTLFSLTGVNFNEDDSIQSSTATATDFFDVVFGTEGIKGLLITLAAAAGSAVIIGFFAKVQGENLIILPFLTGTLALFVSAYVGIINYAISLKQTWLGALVSVIFVPLMIGFVVALVEFFRGTD